MKAVTYQKYGSPEQVLQIKEVTKPTPKDNELLVKIKATTINDYDWSMVTGKPNLYRLMFGLSKPKHSIPGMELSGIVEATGAKVTAFNVGDAVFGDISGYGFGTYAEYVCVPEKVVLKKPESISFEEAAALPHAATLAFQALHDMGMLQQGQNILINGGGGGVGTIGLQLAKRYNCTVTGVDSNEKLEIMTSLGYDSVIDYKTTNFTKINTQYDLILDCKTNRSALAYLNVLKPKGKYITVGGKLSKLFGILFWGKLISIFSSKKLSILALKANKGLSEIIDLHQQQQIKSYIDGPYSLEEIPRLVQYFGEGKHKGKIVIQTDAEKSIS